MKVVVEIEITEKDMAAAKHYVLPGFTEFPDTFTEEHVVRQLLEPEMHATLHEWRSRLKWDEGGFAAILGRKAKAPIEGTWKCLTSPTQVCWYDEHADPAMDECLFCGMPHERL